MNKTAIKNFAIWARNKLIADISYRAGLMGITADGIQKALPQSTGTTEFYDIGTAEPYSISGDDVKQRKHLVELIQRKEKETKYKTAYKYVLEEVAYTWFNRLIAVRFMEVNDYLPSHIRVLSSDSGKMEPDLVTNPFSAGLSFTSEEEQAIYQLKQENKLDEVFRILFIKQCNALNENLPALFEKTSDYTELLLNLSVIDQDGIVYHLVHDIPEEDFDVERGGQVEIIGWLYQFYNTEPKNDTFALLKKNVKITKQTIPAATQVFTPDWVVRYMVENSLGRLWLEGHPNDDLKTGWKYYLEEAEQKPEVQAKLAEIREDYSKLNPEDIKVIDPCMGSGHILVYAFDVLMQIYESVGYGQRDAARSILENNLYGLDIDDRAFQMTYFAVMMKARQFSRRILNGEYKPNVYSIQESNGINRSQLKYLGAGLNEFEKNKAISEINSLLDTFKDAKEYGSILTVDQYDWDLLHRFASGIETIGQISFETVALDDIAEKIKELIAQGRNLAGKYHVTITNPPYMGLSNGSLTLNDYVKKKYTNSKADLSTVFMERCILFTLKYGYISMINIPVWMSLTGYSNLRKELLSSASFVSLLHFGRGVFGADFGTVAFTLNKNGNSFYLGTYKRLFDKSSIVDSVETKEKWFFDENRNYYICQSEFKKIPGTPVAYWINPAFVNAFNAPKLGDIGTSSKGIITGDNARFLRLWQEIQYENINFIATSSEDSKKSDLKWYPCRKGGSARKWFGNNEYVINWKHNGYEVIRCAKSEKRNCQDYADQYKFVPSITWTSVTIGDPTFRYGANDLAESAGMSYFTHNKDLYYVLGFLNSSVAKTILQILSPTVNYTAGSINSLPLLSNETIIHEIRSIVEENILLSKEDWDSFEASWGFKRHPLVSVHGKDCLLEQKFKEWSAQCRCRYEKVLKNEMRIDTLFEELYGVEKPSDENNKEDQISIYTLYETASNIPKQLSRSYYTLTRKDAIKSLLSYIVGCIFGRYSVDYDGIAFGGEYWHQNRYIVFHPDEDNIVPITDEEYFEDDIVGRVIDWIRSVYGDKNVEENLDYIAMSLESKGDTSRGIIRKYFVNDFYKDHCAAYSVNGSGKRPIYWLFDSGKQNGFKALIYLHRYNADTIGNLRIDYLHRMQRIYESEISRMQDMIDHSTSGREVAQATKRCEKLTKQLKECREYDEKLAHLALSRIELDLDDGVKKNYRKIQTASDGKFYEVLADSKNIMSRK